MNFKTGEIKAALLKGGLVIAGRRSGKTTALLQAAAHFGSEDVAILSKSLALADGLRRSFSEAFPSVDIPVMSSRIDSLRGRSVLLIDELTLWTADEQDDILRKAEFFRHWAATGTFYFPHTPVTVIA
jgi:hypothetical protein